MKGKQKALSCGGETVWEAFSETIWARVVVSQTFPRDNGETIFATRCQDVSQGPLGTHDLSSWSVQSSLSQLSLAWHDFDLAFWKFWFRLAW